MNIIFLTLADINNVEDHGIYEDLLREFSKNGHHVYVVSPSERRTGEKTHLISQSNCRILKVRTGNIQKTNILEKGISTVLLERQFISAIKVHLSGVKFDLVLYSTPPITLAGAVKYIKNRDHAKTYLLLKDIFPQNAVDIGMMSKTGAKGLIYKYFRKKEIKLYALSDRIGCMSPANVEFVLKQNPEIDRNRVEVCPNSVEPIDLSVSVEERDAMRTKYGIPLDKKVFVYGGNLGKPQGIPHMIECLKSQTDNQDAFFLIVGSGTEYGLIEDYIKTTQPLNVKLMKKLPKDDYDHMVGSCDVGLIFLDRRFTIPNFPSRLLSYMQAKMPIIAVTDPNSDIGDIIIQGNFGWSEKQNNIESFDGIIREACTADLKEKGEESWKYLLEHYDVKTAAKTIN